MHAAELITAMAVVKKTETKNGHEASIPMKVELFNIMLVFCLYSPMYCDESFPMSGWLSYLRLILSLKPSRTRFFAHFIIIFLGFTS